MSDLKKQLIKLGSTNPELRPHIREILGSFGDNHQLKILKDTVKNPAKGLLGGPSAEEAEEILRKKFKYTEAQIARLKLGSTNSELQPHIRPVLSSLDKSAQVVGFTGNLENAMAQLVRGYTEEVASIAQSLLQKKWGGRWTDKGHGNIHGKVGGIDISIQIRFSSKEPRIMSGYVTNENLNTSLALSNNWYKDTKSAAHYVVTEVTRSFAGVGSQWEGL